MIVKDPIERIVAQALKDAGISFVMDGHGETSGLDFRLMAHPPVYIECKAYHTDRIANQTARVENVIVIQGADAAKWFAANLRNLWKPD